MLSREDDKFIVRATDKDGTHIEYGPVTQQEARVYASKLSREGMPNVQVFDMRGKDTGWVLESAKPLEEARFQFVKGGQNNVLSR